MPGTLITIIFTLSNTYLGLKIGFGFTSSIPAAVIPMASLRLIDGRGPVCVGIVAAVARR